MLKEPPVTWDLEAPRPYCVPYGAGTVITFEDPVRAHELITHRIDVRSCIEVKRAAMRSHASQIADASFFLQMPDEAYAMAFGMEWFTRRGAAPGTRECDLLAPENTVQQVHALLLSGGSAFGLDAAGGVMRWLEEQDIGFATSHALVPIVPAAVIYDLGVGNAAETLASTDIMKEVDANTTMANAIRNAWGYRMQGTNFTNEAWYAQNWISARTWDPVAPTPIAPATQRISMLDNHVWHTAGQGFLRVNVDLAGTYRVTLRDMQGRALARRDGSGAGEMEFAAPGHTQSLYLLEVRSGLDTYTRVVTF